MHALDCHVHSIGEKCSDDASRHPRMTVRLGRFALLSRTFNQWCNGMDLTQRRKVRTGMCQCGRQGRATFTAIKTPMSVILCNCEVGALRLRDECNG